MPGPLVVLNPAANGGRARTLAGRLAARLAAEPGGELAVTAEPGEATALAAEAARDGRPRVVAVGGDGTVQEVVNGLLTGEGILPELGIVPVGSGNDLARSLRLPRAGLAAWITALRGPAAALDVLHATDGAGRSRAFASAGGVGFDAQVAAATAGRSGWRRGQLGYLMTTLDELRRFGNRPLSITLDDATPFERTVLFVAIANGPWYGGGMRICPPARTDDGALDLCIVGDVSRLTALREIPRLYRGTHVRNPAVELRRAARVRIDGDAETRIHLDGEPWGTLPLDVEVRPAALRVAVGG